VTGEVDMFGGGSKVIRRARFFPFFEDPKGSFSFIETD
jgi:hypothetical protein